MKTVPQKAVLHVMLEWRECWKEGGLALRALTAGRRHWFQDTPSCGWGLASKSHLCNVL